MTISKDALALVAIKAAESIKSFFIKLSWKRWRIPP